MLLSVPSVAQQEAQRAQFLVEKAKQEQKQKIVQAEGEATAAKMISCSGVFCGMSCELGSPENLLQWVCVDQTDEMIASNRLLFVFCGLFFSLQLVGTVFVRGYSSEQRP